MATKKAPAASATPSSELAPQATGRALSTWQDQLAAEAAEVAKMEASTSTGAFFKTKAGQLVWDEAPLPDNQMAVVILDSVFDTTYYEAEYDPDSPASPVAFALGRDEATLAWHETSDPRFAGKLCRESEVCQFGSAERGAGKAARESRRLAVVPAGKFDKTGKFLPFKKAEELETAPVGFLKVPPTSTKAYSAFVKQLAGSLKRPPHGIFTKVKLVPDPKTQFRFVFEPLMQVPDDLMPTVMNRREEAKLGIMQPYQMTPPEAEPTKRPSAKAPAKGAKAAPAKKPGTRRF